MRPPFSFALQLAVTEQRRAVPHGQGAEGGDKAVSNAAWVEKVEIFFQQDAPNRLSGGDAALEGLVGVSEDQHVSTARCRVGGRDREAALDPQSVSVAEQDAQSLPCEKLFVGRDAKTAAAEKWQRHPITIAPHRPKGVVRDLYIGEVSQAVPRKKNAIGTRPTKDLGNRVGMPVAVRKNAKCRARHHRPPVRKFHTNSITRNRSFVHAFLQDNQNFWDHGEQFGALPQTPIKTLFRKNPFSKGS